MPTATTLTLDQLLLACESSDVLEEAAEDFLSDHRIPLHSHNRRRICLQAWNNGWRPTTTDLYS